MPATLDHARADMLVIERALTVSGDVRALIGELDTALSVHYAPDQRHGLTLDAIFQPHIRFFLARKDGAAIGCGGIAFLPDFAEIKRMYVRSAARGQGIADAILDRLAAEALSQNVTLLRLETGTQQSAALRFYQRQSFHPCAAFEPYASMPLHSIATSVFLERDLSLD